ncbi:MAG TPA: DUF1707 domain-containing protein [Pseudonocardiaceae bacterium]
MFGERSARRRTKADGDELRASDAEREYVVDLLQRAVGQGMLDLDEFGQRTDIALAARTRAELNRVLLDLPIRDEPMRADTDEVLGLRSTLSEVVRRGNWRVPSRLLIISRLGSTKLDFTDAEFTSPQVEIELAVTGGSVHLLVPPTAAVYTTAVTTIGGQIVDARPTTTGFGAPTLILTGKVRAGEVRIRRPRLAAALLRVSVAVGLRAAEQLARRLPAR